VFSRSSGNCCRGRINSLLNPSGSDPVSGTTIKAEKKFMPQPGHVIVCRACGSLVTTPDAVITVKNHHRHTFINPAGITFQIGCFSSAEGCIVHGVPVTEHTWFPGFAWNYATCSNCGAHLGWFFQRNDKGFFGLILDLLADSTGNH